MPKPTIKHYMDGYRHCVEVQVVGKAPILHVYNDRRCAMTFPTSGNPGYFCLFGLKDVVTHRDKLPLQLLSEHSSKDQEKLFDHLVNTMRRYNCGTVYADCSKDFLSSEIEFGRFIQARGIRFVGLFDASEFEGFNTTYAGFEAARAPIDEYGRKGMLDIPESSTLRRELRSMLNFDMNDKPQVRFPAVNAFNHIIMSYVLSPWEKPFKQQESMQTEGYGG